MSTPKNGKPEPLRVIGSISKLVGTVVGTAVVTGKRVIRSVRSSSEGLSDKPGERTVHAPAPAKTKKKKVVKRKGTGSSGVSRASVKTPAQSPAKKKKGVKLKKKTRLETKKATRSEGSSHSPVGLISEIDTGMNVPIGEQEPQL